MNSILPDPTRWIVVFIDIVDYSTKCETEQAALVRELTATVHGSNVIRNNQSVDRMFLPTGDGMAIAFPSGNPAIPLRLATEIHKKYGERRFIFKIGIHSGIAFEITDINGQRNMAGSGINKAQRVESCCEGGHILVESLLAAELERTVTEWKSSFKGPYDFRVKHNEEIQASNFFNVQEKFGNQAEPTKNRTFVNAYITLNDLLAKRGILPSEELRDERLLKALGHPLIMERIVVDGSFCDYAGVPFDQIRVNKSDGSELEIAPYVLEAKHQMIEPVPNRAKVLLAKAKFPIIDQGNILALTLQETDFWTSKAIDSRIPLIHRDWRVKASCRLVQVE